MTSKHIVAFLTNWEMRECARACFNFSSFPKAFTYCSTKSGVLTSCFKSRGMALTKIVNQMLPEGWCMVHARGSQRHPERTTALTGQKRGHGKKCLNATSDVYAPCGLARHIVIHVNPMKPAWTSKTGGEQHEHEPPWICLENEHMLESWTTMNM